MTLDQAQQALGRPLTGPELGFFYRYGKLPLTVEEIRRVSCAVLAKHLTNDTNP